MKRHFQRKLLFKFERKRFPASCNWISSGTN